MQFGMAQAKDKIGYDKSDNPSVMVYLCCHA